MVGLDLHAEDLLHLRDEEVPVLTSRFCVGAEETLAAGDLVDVDAPRPEASGGASRGVVHPDGPTVGHDLVEPTNPRPDVVFHHPRSSSGTRSPCPISVTHSQNDRYCSKAWYSVRDGAFRFTFMNSMTSSSVFL